MKKLKLSIILMLISFTLKAAKTPCEILTSYKIPPKTSQIILVKTSGKINATLTLCQKQYSSWQPKLRPFNVVIGKAGLAPLGTKKEGDLKTPAGLYPLGEAFGTKPMALKMDYKYITFADKFIDDVSSKDYNSWVLGPTEAKSYETMLTKIYALGLVINYNMQPRIAGAGSAIFIHIWRSPTTGTSGCIALKKSHLEQLLYLLDKKFRPHVLII